MKKLEFLLKALEPIKHSKIDLDSRHVSSFLVCIFGYKISALKKGKKWICKRYYPFLNSKGDFIWKWNSTIEGWDGKSIKFDSPQEAYQQWDNWEGSMHKPIAQ